MKVLVALKHLTPVPEETKPAGTGCAVTKAQKQQ